MMISKLMRENTEGEKTSGDEAHIFCLETQLLNLYLTRCRGNVNASMLSNTTRALSELHDDTRN